MDNNTKRKSNQKLCLVLKRKMYVVSPFGYAGHHHRGPERSADIGRNSGGGEGRKGVAGEKREAIKKSRTKETTLWPWLTMGRGSRSRGIKCSLAHVRTGGEAMCPLPAPSGSLSRPEGGGRACIIQCPR